MSERERRFYEALLGIMALDPASTDEGHNEWGEALCFRRAQDIASYALNPPSALDHAFGSEQCTDTPALNASVELNREPL
jgi:hypothetical protein